MTPDGQQGAIARPASFFKNNNLNQIHYGNPNSNH